MKSDKIFLVRANHYLKKTDLYCKLEKSLIEENAWNWITPDIADGELQDEQYCAKFKTEEESIKFKETFNQCCNDQMIS